MNNKEPAFILNGRQKDRDTIAYQVKDFLAKGGKIEVLGSTLDQNSNPKCRVADDIGLHR